MSHGSLRWPARDRKPHGRGGGDHAALPLHRGGRKTGAGEVMLREGLQHSVPTHFAVERGVLPMPTDHLTEHALEALAEIERHAPLDPLVFVELVVAFAQRVDDRLFVREVLVERTDRYARYFGDPVRRQTRLSVGLQNVSRGKQDRVDGRTRARLARHFAFHFARFRSHGHLPRQPTGARKSEFSEARCSHTLSHVHRTRTPRPGDMT